MTGDEQHIRFIATLLPAGYKIVRAGDSKRGRKKGSTHSPETKARISRALTGRKLTDETKRKISEARKYSYADRIGVLQDEIDLLKKQLAQRAA